MQHCQNYTTEINGLPAIFTVNIEDSTIFQNQHCNKIVQCSIPYESEDDGLPKEQVYDFLLGNLFNIITELSALPKVFFAGQFLSNSEAKLHFYCDDTSLLMHYLNQIPFVQDVNIQDDPNWDVYFDFLLASPLEIKLNATEELLRLLKEKGKDLSDSYVVEHTFHFNDEEPMFNFMEKLSLEDYSFHTLQYSSQPIRDEDEELEYYMVKLSQEMSFDNDEIFDSVKEFEQLANEFSGEYIGWECDSLIEAKNSLN